MRARDTARAAARETPRPAAREAPRPAHIALFDATTLTAKGVKEQLVERRFPSASLRLFTSSDDPDCNLTEFKGEAMLVTRPDIDTVGTLDIAFLCGAPQDGARYLEWPRHAGFTAIDLTTASRGARGVPVVNAAVNPGAVASWTGVIATPDAVAQALSSLLAPIIRGPGLEAAVAVVFAPASERGEEGIDELYRQTIAVLNFQDIPKNVFGRQLAFNLIPALADAGGAGRAGASSPALETEILGITGGTCSLAVQTVLAPVFHCHAAAVHVTLPAGRTREDLVGALKGGEDLKMSLRGGVTPVEGAGAVDVTIGGVRPSAEDGGFWVWAVADNLAAGTARNAVRIAEQLMVRNLARRPS